MIQNILTWLLTYAAQLVLAIAILYAGHFVGRNARRGVRRLVARPEVVTILSPTIGRLLCDLVYYALVGVAIALALIVVGVPGTFVLSISSVIFILIAVSLQQSLSNLAATVIFLAFQPFRRGEVVETLGKIGTVQEIQLFNTVLHMGDQRMVSLSNSEIQTGGVVNHTRRGIVRNEVTFTVTYQTNLGQVRQIIQALLDQDARILEDPPPSIMVLELGDSGVRMAVYCMSAPADGGMIMSDLRTQIKARFDAEGIAFARHEVHVTANPMPSLGTSAGDAAASAA